MQFGIDFNEPSTLRGLFLLIGTIIIGAGWLLGRVDTNSILAILTTAIGGSGAVGLFTKSTPDK